jgi:hypothetical protein
MARAFHVFYTEAVGLRPVHKEFMDERELLAFVTTANDPDFSNVQNLRVVYGELLEFEPAKVIESYRIKGGVNR